MTLYLFRDGVVPWGNAVVCVGEKDLIEAALGRMQVRDLFHGEIVYTSHTTKQDYLGVWARETLRASEGFCESAGSKSLFNEHDHPIQSCAPA